VLELAAGVLVALVVLVLVLEPLTRGAGGKAFSGRDLTDVPEFFDPEESDSPKFRALTALREIEFDRATGKLSDEDYAKLKAQYSAAALEAIRAEETIESAVADQSPDDLAEQAVERAKSGAGVKDCPVCGRSPQPGSVFCSTCGCFLAAPEPKPRCASCGSAVQVEAKFCLQCGSETAMPQLVG